MLIMFLVGISFIIIGLVVQIYTVLKTDNKEFNEWYSQFKKAQAECFKELLAKDK